MKPWVVIGMFACACSAKPATPPSNGSQGSQHVEPVDPVANAKTCDEIKPRVEKLYRADATVHEPKRIEAAVADNTAMVMTDCAKDPGKLVPCLANAPTAADLEKQCLVQLDDEGTEGEALRK